METYEEILRRLREKEEAQRRIWEEAYQEALAPYPRCGNDRSG
jgi:hypothetical protein